jgi:hypothetical protein
LGRRVPHACQYHASAIAKVDRQLYELAGSRNELHSFHNPDTDVDLLKMVHRDFGFDRSGDEIGHGLCSIAAIATASISIRYSEVGGVGVDGKDNVYVFTLRRWRLCHDHQ